MIWIHALGGGIEINREQKNWERSGFVRNTETESKKKDVHYRGGVRNARQKHFEFL